MNLNMFDLNAMPDGFDELTNEFGAALAGNREALFMEIEVSGEMPMGAEVYPSQEFLPAVKKSKEKGKVLSSINIEYKGHQFRQATMHSQKIGNAIRWIDEWHGQTDDYGTTSVEVYGYIQSRSDAIRVPGKGKDLYSLLKDIENITVAVQKAKSVDEIDGNLHYLMAVLIRGGVFSGESKADKANAKNAAKNKTAKNNELAQVGA